MCIRDSFEVGVSTKYTTLSSGDQRTRFFGGGLDYLALGLPCLLYTSDAADDLLCVDLGGRRII